MEKIIVTGGCGFIGSHLVERLLEKGIKPVIIDALNPQVHKDGMIISRGLLEECEFIHDDIRERRAWQKALDSASAVVHLAAETGVGQSMYEIERYSDVNVTGTAVMLECMARAKSGIGKIILASSRAVYGEGDCECRSCGTVRPDIRPLAQLKNSVWEVKCPHCGSEIKSIATKEASSTAPASVYGATKLAQENLIRSFCRGLGLASVTLRYQNVYGPRQSLSNPYTGLLAVFSNRIRQGLPLDIYEDGLMSRDFVYVSDAVDALYSALVNKKIKNGVFNIGTGRPATVLRVAQELGSAFDRPVKTEFNGHFRIGDIRHCFADISLAESKLAYRPVYDLASGLKSWCEWVLSQEEVADASEFALKELQDMRKR